MGSALSIFSKQSSKNGYLCSETMQNFLAAYFKTEGHFIMKVIRISKSRDNINCYLNIRHLSKIFEWKMRTEFFPLLGLMSYYFNIICIYLAHATFSRVPRPTRIVYVVAGPQYHPWSIVNNTYRNRNWAAEQQLSAYQWQIRAWLIAWLRNKPEPKQKRPCQPLPPSPFARSGWGLPPNTQHPAAQTLSDKNAKL